MIADLQEVTREKGVKYVYFAVDVMSPLTWNVFPMR